MGCLKSIRHRYIPIKTKNKKDLYHETNCYVAISSKMIKYSSKRLNTIKKILIIINIQLLEVLLDYLQIL